MIDQLKALYARYRETVNYLIFGVATTVVNFVVYGALVYFGVHYIAAQTIAWIAAVIFAYVTNRIWVFESHARGVGAIAAEFVSFTASRLFSFGVETLLLWLMVDVGGISEIFAKIPVAVITVVLNYVTGKLLVFRKK